MNKVYIRKPILKYDDIIQAIVTTPITGQCFLYPFFHQVFDREKYFSVVREDDSCIFFKFKDGFTLLTEANLPTTTLNFFVSPPPVQLVMENYWKEALGVGAFWKDRKIILSKDRDCSDPSLTLAEFYEGYQHQGLKQSLWQHYSDGPIVDGPAQNLDFRNWIEQQFFVGVQDAPRYTLDILAFTLGLNPRDTLPAYQNYVEAQRMYVNDLNELRKNGFIKEDKESKITADMRSDTEFFKFIKRITNIRHQKVIQEYQKPHWQGYSEPVNTIVTTSAPESVTGRFDSLKKKIKKGLAILFPIWSPRTIAVSKVFHTVLIRKFMRFIYRMIAYLERKSSTEGKFEKSERLLTFEKRWFPQSTTRGQYYHRMRQEIFPVDKDREYREWYQHERTKAEEIPGQINIAKSITNRPKISFITPVYNPELWQIKFLAESVLNQTYANWELCLANASTDNQVNEYLSRLAESDERVKMVLLDENFGISKNSNSAIALATGEFIAILDHDDVIEPDYLYRVVLLLNEEPDTDVIYFDEDKLDLNGKQCQPWFKPQTFDPALLLCANFLMHSIYKKSLVEKVGGFNPAYDGAQDWDLALRVSTETDHIRHIARILYHWRMTPKSTAYQVDAKSFAKEAQKACLEEYLQSMDIQKPEVNFTFQNYPFYVWKSQKQLISIVIPTKDRIKMLNHCLEGIMENSKDHEYEIILVDSGSKEKRTKDYYDRLRSDSRINIIELNREKFNYSSSINIGTSKAKGDLLLLLNNDTRPINQRWLDELSMWFEFPDTGVVGAKLLYPNHHIQHNGITVGTSGLANHIFYDLYDTSFTLMGSTDWYRSYLAVTGACQMVRKSVFEEVHGYNEGFSLILGDVEFCLRVRDAGYNNIVNPFARLYHYESVSRGKGERPPKDDVMAGAFKFYPYILAGDPYFNNQLSYLEPIPTLRSRNEKTRLDCMQEVFDQNNINWSVRE